MAAGSKLTERRSSQRGGIKGGRNGVDDDDDEVSKYSYVETSTIDVRYHLWAATLSRVVNFMRRRVYRNTKICTTHEPPAGFELPRHINTHAMQSKRIS